MDTTEFTESLKAEAKRLGFELSGACPAIQPNGYSQLESWIDAGFHGEMSYFETRRTAYQDPNSVLEGVTSILMLGMNYRTRDPKDCPAGSGRISRYAWGGKDYHDLIHSRLKDLRRFAQKREPNALFRGVVDTAPLMEREFAQLAGLGWSAKNTMLINPKMGSWFFLAALLTDQTLAYDSPFQTHHCGTCQACLTECPTDAFVKPGILDATRCISYLTIEHRSPIPLDLRPKMDGWILGCDVCQDVCPWNNKAPATSSIDFEPEPSLNPIELTSLFDLDDESFRERFRKTPLWRPKRRGILRNAAIALGNRPSQSNISPLIGGLNDSESLVRGASAWALGQHHFPEAKIALIERQTVEDDATVQIEIMQAIETNNSGGK